MRVCTEGLDGHRVGLRCCSTERAAGYSTGVSAPSMVVAARSYRSHQLEFIYKIYVVKAVILARFDGC